MVNTREMPNVVGDSLSANLAADVQGREDCDIEAIWANTSVFFVKVMFSSLPSQTHCIQREVQTILVVQMSLGHL